jgi:hypothetical protein
MYRARLVGYTCSSGQGLRLDANIEEPILCHRDAHIRARRQEGAQRKAAAYKAKSVGSAR